MKLLPPLSKFSLKQWFLIFSVISWGGLAWILHFIYEFQIIIEMNAPLAFISFHFIAIVIGSIFALKFVSKWSHFPSYLGFISLQVIFYITLGWIKELWFIPIGLFGAGFSIGIVFGLYKEQFVFIMEEPKFGGRMYALGLLGCAPFVIIQALINVSNFSINTFYFLAILFMIISITLVGRSDHKIPPQENLNLREFVTKKENLPKMAVGFFFGFFITNSYYATFLILEGAGFQSNLSHFVIVLWLTVGLFGFLNGFFMDLIGRRIIISIGLCVQALAFLLISFLGQSETMLLYVFPLILGIGFTMTINGSLCFFIEDPPPQFVRDTNFVYFGVSGIGMLTGVALGELMRPIVLIDPGNLTILLLFIFVLATVVIFQIKEPLPVKEELEWQNAVLEFYCIHSGSGICMYHHIFMKTTTMDENLLAGGISGVCTLVEEMFQTGTQTQVIDQGDHKLLLEFGEKTTCLLISKSNLKTLREKLRDITEEIEFLYKNVIETQHVNPKIFKPIGNLAKKYFT